MTPNNPLKQYFRQPAIYLRLPSGGQFYPDGTLDMPPNGEIPVLPMTAVDEITYRTPDALFNGSATISVIQSCIPSIKNPWVIPAMDVDTILVGIRVASYGHDMEIATQCPNCKQTADYNVDLRSVLDNIKKPDYTQQMHHGDLEIYFRPMTYKNLNDNNQNQFDEQKMLSLLPDQDVPDTEKLNAITEALKKITRTTVKALSQSIAAVKTPSALVTDPVFIEELLNNCDRKIFNGIRDHIIKLKNMAEIQPLKIQCPECSHEYTQQVTLDMVSFFAPAS